MKTFFIAAAVALLLTPSMGIAQDFDKGLAAARAGDLTTALKEWEPLAEQGDGAAQTLLGSMYFNGEGVVQDYSEAVGWFQKAAEQGHRVAQINLGAMYDQGLGVVQDYTAAARWYRKAAEQGYAAAQYNLGAMYMHGHGVIQDKVYAHMWFNIAASGGNDMAAENRDRIAGTMTSEQVAEAQKLARECVKKDFNGC